MTVRKRKNWLKCVGILVLAMILVGGGFLIWRGFGAEEEGDSGASQSTGTKPEEKKKEEGGETKKDESGNGKVEENKVDVGKEKVEQFDGGDPNQGEELTGVITYAGASDDNLMVRVNIDQYLEAGACRLKLMKDGGVIYEEMAEIMGSAATATCRGFNVPIAKVGSGKTEITILVTSGEKTGTIEGEVSL